MAQEDKDMDNMNITEALANRILEWMELADYEVTDIYEQSFRALRKNDYILSELDVELDIDPRHLDKDNAWQYTSHCTHVLKRYQ